MLGLALGDALGATVEFMTPREIAASHGVHDRICGGGWLRLASGMVTDDTTMSFALAEAWLASDGPPDAEACAHAFDAWMRGKPVDIGNTVRRGILRWRLHATAQAACSEQAGNGATMRCLPVALATLGAEPAVVRRAALTQARVTHHNPLTDEATLCVVDMVQLALLGAGQAVVLARAAALGRVHAAFAAHGRRCENPSGYIVDTLRAVFQALAAAADFETVLVDVVNRGGDADTTGAIAGMIMGALVGEAGLPQHWRGALRREVAAECARLADALIARAPLCQSDDGLG